MDSGEHPEALLHKAPDAVPQALLLLTENGIRSEFKDALDSYEAFIDEYIEFMKEYAESDNPLSMLEEYSEMLIQYTETMQALDDLGNEEMSEAVMTRINQKLLESV